MKKDFWIDFSGTLLVRDVENKEEAINAFWQTISDHNSTFENEFHYCEVQGVEKK